MPRSDIDEFEEQDFMLNDILRVEIVSVMERALNDRKYKVRSLRGSESSKDHAILQALRSERI